MPQKLWWKSSTIWVNLIGIAVPILDTVLATNFIADKEVYALILAVLNILNRFRVSPAKPVEPIAKKVL